MADKVGFQESKVREQELSAGQIIIEVNTAMRTSLSLYNIIQADVQPAKLPSRDSMTSQ